MTSSSQVPAVAGQLAWFTRDDARGREQHGRRPWLIVSSVEHRQLSDTLAIAVPCTRTDRGWPNHVRLTGSTSLTDPTFAMTEQPFTVSIDRLHMLADSVDDSCVDQVAFWLHRWVVPSRAA